MSGRQSSAVDKARRPAGRPPLHGTRMATHHVKLDVATVAYLRELGGGNLSRGIRLAAQSAASGKAALPLAVLPPPPPPLIKK